MTSNEKDLIAMKEAGMIDQFTFDSMWEDLHAGETGQTGDLPSEPPVTETFPPVVSQAQPKQGINISGGAYTVKGAREQNEDSFLLGSKTGGTKGADQAVFSARGDGPFFFAAADGMGGHDAGDVASAFVVEKLWQRVSSQTAPVDDDLIEAMLKNIHAELLAEARRRGTPKMGSTIAGIVLQKEKSGYYNAGDSRVYRLRHGYIQQLSQDDSLARLVPGAAKNIITNAVGAGQKSMSVASQFSPNLAVPGDVFLMCSDGVHGAVNDDDIALILGLKDSPPDIARIIVERAINNNSDDNCTAVVVKVLE